ncbi:MAG: iron-sulfur cluster assembly scaffold protein [Nanoarchaeota archaeon]|nr:iron-sulfur cluster assembly scaffold protein [Nanoarchaeota archaeon]
MYSKKVVDRFSNPKNSGEMKDADAIGEEGNPRCGDVMKIYLKVENEKIIDVKFQTYGCIAAIACSDALCELAKGKTITEAKKIKSQDILNELGKLPPIKIHCSILGMEALQNVIKNYETKKAKNN